MLGEIQIFSCVCSSSRASERHDLGGRIRNSYEHDDCNKREREVGGIIMAAIIGEKMEVTGGGEHISWRCCRRRSRLPQPCPPVVSVLLPLSSSRLACAPSFRSRAPSWDARAVVPYGAKTVIDRALGFVLSLSARHTIHHRRRVLVGCRHVICPRQGERDRYPCHPIPT